MDSIHKQINIRTSMKHTCKIFITKCMHVCMRSTIFNKSVQINMVVLFWYLLKRYTTHVQHLNWESHVYKEPEAHSRV